MSRPWERPLPTPEALSGLSVPPPASEPRRTNAVSVYFSPEEWTAVQAASEAREGEALSTTVRVLSVAAAEHLVDRGRWPKGQDRPASQRGPRRSKAVLAVFSDAEFAILEEAAMHRWGEPVSATVRALAVAAARHLLGPR